MHPTKGSAIGKIMIIAILLAAFTLIEYYVAIAIPSTVLLFLLALIKAWLVVYFYMHISRIWSSDGGH